jgi:hypothetical protein
MTAYSEKTDDPERGDSVTLGGFEIVSSLMIIDIPKKIWGKSRGQRHLLTVVRILWR